MRAVWLRLGAELRMRWRAWLGLSLLVGLAAGAVMGLAAGARRTDSAYPRFLQAHNAYDVLVVNYPEDGTAVYDFDELARLPQVSEAARAVFQYFTFDTANLASMDGRIGTDINRAKILQGRQADPDDPGEIVVGFTLAEEHGIAVGEKIDLLPPEILQAAASPDPVSNPFPEVISDEKFGEYLAGMREFLAAVPDGKLTVVGIGAAPGEFPPQFQLNRILVHLTPAFARMAADGEHEALVVRLHGGSAAVAEFLAELERRSGGLPPQVAVQRDHAAAVQRSIGFQVVALWLLAGLTALAGVLIVGQLLARLTHLESVDHPVLRALGMSARDLITLGVLRAAAIGVGGAVVGVVAAPVASPFFPIGLARVAEPTPGVDADPLVLGVGAVLTVAVVAALGVWPAWRAARTAVAGDASRAPARPSRLAGAVAGSGAPAPAVVGVRMALEPGRGHSAVPVRSTLTGVSLGVTTLVAALTFGASLGHLLANPRLYGLTYDLELYGPYSQGNLVDLGALDILRNDQRVEAVGVGGLAIGATIEVEGRRVDAVMVQPVEGDVVPPVLDGRAPTSPDEIAVGVRTLRSLDADVGDVVAVRVPGVAADPVPMRVVGAVVLPTVSEGAQLGHGALLTPAGLTLLDPEEEGLAVIVRLTPGADGQEVVDDLSAALDLHRPDLGEGVYALSGGQPTDIVNFGRVEAMPLLLGGLLAAISAGALTHLLLSAVRRRRRDLAVLKTLGFVRRQVGATVASQATTVVGIGLVVGIPAGVALGRWAWALMANDLGVVSHPQVPALAVVVVAATGVLLANAIAVVPGRVAARTPAASVLRSE